VAAGALALAMTQGAFAQGTVKIGSVLVGDGAGVVPSASPRTRR
jgi:hypothetical protein